MGSKTKSGAIFPEPELQAWLVEFDRRASPTGKRLTLRAWLELAATWRILVALQHCRGNRSAAARALGTPPVLPGRSEAESGAAAATTKNRSL